MMRAGKIVVVMGVAGAGKTTVGRALAAAIGARFLDADDLHPDANVEKMRRSVPLDDADRAPWLARVRSEVARAGENGESLVVACSALREDYRRTITPKNEAISFVLLDAPKEVLRDRIAARRDHFFPAELLDSQFATLQPPNEALIVDATCDVDAIVATIVDALRG